MKQEELEVEEKTVERTYCDECGSDCTDNHKIEPKHVCYDCSTDDFFDDMKEFIKDRYGKDGEVEPTGFTVGAVVVLGAPLLVAFCFTQVFSDKIRYRTGSRDILTIMAGAVFWTLIIASFALGV